MNIMCVHFEIIYLFFSFWAYSATSMHLQKNLNFFVDGGDTNIDVADLIASKGYLPKDKDLLELKPSLDKSETEVTYLLSKLSDRELVKLLNDQPKKSEYDLNDLVNVAIQPKSEKRYHKVNGDKPEAAVFRLDNTEVDPYIENIKADAKDVALSKLNNILFSRQEESFTDDDEDVKRELLFDSLVAQLKALCCKSSKSQNKVKEENLANDNLYVPQQEPTSVSGTVEEMFLILNDDIKSKGSDELIYVDPDSLSQNSSVLLLGPLSSPLSDTQLQAVMRVITNELAKPEYQLILKQLSDGALKDSNVLQTLNLVSGPQSRRYIKPHRCNYQAKLSKTFGGTRWILCTGYINLNAASLYD